MKGIRIEDRKLRIAFVGAQREAGKTARVLMAIRGAAFLSDSFPPGIWRNLCLPGKQQGTGCPVTDDARINPCAVLTVKLRWIFKKTDGRITEVFLLPPPDLPGDG